MSTERPATFGQLLRRFREQSELTQEELAERAGLSVDAIGLLERGARQRPQRYTMQKLVEALRLAPEERMQLERSAHAARQAGSRPRVHLPRFATPLVDRLADVAALVSLLDAGEIRLLTLTGPGGVGKTRLAVAVAEQIAVQFPDGVIFVPLAALNEPQLIASAIGQGLGLREFERFGSERRLRDHLRHKRLLLLLDNFEHLLPGATLVADLLATCPDVTVLATSRAPLHISSEQQFPVPPLDTPGRTQRAELAQLEQFPAIALFQQRARAVVPTFAVTSTNVNVVAEICRRLDGLPLAIELAAAWTKVLSPEALLQRLERALPILAAGPRDLPARHQSLRAAIDWSYSLLPEVEQTLFRRASVFVGSCTLPAVEAVCSLDGAGAQEVLLGLRSLVDKSLMHLSVQVQTRMPAPGNQTAEPGADAVVPAEAEERFAMLETIREFAAERLRASGEHDAIEQRHAAYFLTLTEEAQAQLVGPDEARWMLRLETEHPNLRAALRWALDRREAGMAVRFAAVLWRFWVARGHLSEGRRWLNQVRALAEDVDETVSPAQRAMLLHVTAILTRVQGDYAEAATLYRQCLDIRRGLNDLHGIGGALHNLGIVAYEQGDYAEADRLLREALDLNRSLGGDYGIAFALTSLADVVRARRDPGQAIPLYEESLARFQRIGHTWGMALALKGLADVALDQGQSEQAGARYRESLGLSCQLGDTLSAIACLEGLAQTASARDEFARAARLLAAATVARDMLGASRSPVQDAAIQRVLTVLHDKLDAETYSAAWEDGEDVARQEDVAAFLRLNDAPTRT